MDDQLSSQSNQILENDAATDGTIVTPSGSESWGLLSQPADEENEIESKEYKTNQRLFLGTSDEMIALYHDEKLKPLLEKTTGESDRKDGFAGYPRLLESGDFADVELEIGPERTRIRAHCGILSESSPLFLDGLKDMLARPSSPRDIPIYPLQSVHCDTMKVILRYMYTGQISHSLHPGLVARLYIEANFFGIEVLMNHVIEYFRSVMTTGNPLAVESEISANYVVGMIQGLAQGVSGKGWGVFDVVLEAAVRRSDFDQWMEEPVFLDMLDKNTIPARIILQKCHRILKELKSQQAREKRLRIEKEQQEKEEKRKADEEKKRTEDEKKRKTEEEKKKKEKK